MEHNAVEILELDKIKSKIKENAATGIGKEVIAGLSPVADKEYVEERLQEVTAGCKILEDFGSPPFGGICDLRKIIKKVDKGIVLSAGELTSVLNTLGGFKAMKKYFNEITASLDPRVIENYYSLVTSEGERIEILKELENELDRCLDEYGEIEDNASKKLASIRMEITSLGNKIRNKMDSIVKSNKYQKMLQDNVITRRQDRYVVQVKSEYRNVFQGIVHDQSASGMTLFMEPMAIVRMNNRLRELRSQEEQEVLRILQKLTGMVEEKIDVIKRNLKITTMLDVVFARAEYSQKIDGIAPDINDEGFINISQGRHPLLRDEAVPIDIAVGKDFKTLVITGPNTGGKTVALKTIGLFVLMVETGLHIPAGHGTAVSVFKDVFADIGDEQSIEQNLSTFSSHMTRIKLFLEEAGKDSLVLLDELGAGTDPREGAALGIAIMDRLREREVSTVVTTHYSQLKSYAYNNKGVENASVEFDLDTLRPTYRILMGIPGGSNAFAIASRLGIPDEIVGEARELLSGDEVEVENIITGLNAERKKYSQLKEEYHRKEQEAERLEEKYRRLLDSINKRKKEIISRAHQQAAEIVNRARKESKDILQELKNSDFTSRSEVDRIGNEINKEFKIVDSKIETEDTFSQKEKEQEDDRPIAVGDRVRLHSVGRKGKVIDIDEEKDKATVQAGVITIKADLEELVRVDIPAQKKEEMIKKYKVSKSRHVSSTLDLRGERYDDAQHKLDKYL
ncbi:MAG: endonuclease MutS2, partial [Halanaerobiales bacterium]